ncbi:MAG: hypothetical protein HC877_14960 [Thioploca sp.]|nr:hypothetical protein [Thioploca sp.]
MNKIIVLVLILGFRLSQAETGLTLIEKSESSTAKRATTVRLNTPEGITVATMVACISLT